MAGAKNLRIKRSREALDFSSLAKLLAGQGADEFVTSEMLIPYMTEKLTEYQNNLIAGAPAALDNLNEIAQKLGALSASDSTFENSLATILGTMATITGVDAKLALKADLSFVESSNATINAQIAQEITDRTAEVLRVEGIANSKITEARSISISNDYYQLANVRLLDIENTQLPAIHSEITQKIADSVQAERVVAYNNQETNNATLIQLIQTKATPAQATAISEALVLALRTEMLAIEGIDSARFEALNALLAQLTALEEGDVTGIMNLLSQKVDKTDVLDQTWGSSALPMWLDYINVPDASLQGKVLNAILVKNILNDVYNNAQTKVSGVKIAKSSWIDPSQTYAIEQFLDESVLDSNAVFSAELVQGIIKVLNTKVDTKLNASSLFSESYVLGSIGDYQNYDLLTAVSNDTTFSSSALMGVFRAIKAENELKADKTTVQTMQATITTQEQTIATQQADYVSLLQRVMDLEDAMAV